MDHLLSMYFAVSPQDFTAISTTLFFDACEVQNCEYISIINDAVPEFPRTELFNITLEGISVPDNVLLDPINAVIEITDNDGTYSNLVT